MSTPCPRHAALGRAPEERSIVELMEMAECPDCSGEAAASASATPESGPDVPRLPRVPLGLQVVEAAEALPSFRYEAGGPCLDLALADDPLEPSGEGDLAARARAHAEAGCAFCRLGLLVHPTLGRAYPGSLAELVSPPQRLAWREERARLVWREGRAARARPEPAPVAEPAGRVVELPRSARRRWAAMLGVAAAGLLAGFWTGAGTTWKGEATTPGVLVLSGAIEPGPVRVAFGQGLRPKVATAGPIEIVWRPDGEVPPGVLVGWWVPDDAPRAWRPVRPDGSLGDPPTLGDLSGGTTFRAPADGALVLTVVPPEENPSAIAGLVGDASLAPQRALGAFWLVAIDVDVP